MENDNLSETSDNYKFVIKQIDDTHRIIRCKEDIQHISQIKTGVTSKWPWRAISYYVTKAGAERQTTPFREVALSLFPQSTSVASLRGNGEARDVFMCVDLVKAKEAAPRVSPAHCESVS